MKIIIISIRVLIAVIAFACTVQKSPEPKVQVSRDINAVKEAHTQELMATEGVVGVYVGVLDDNTPCIGIMVIQLTSELKQKLPKTLEGYPVRIEETGEIKPLK